ncbi:50S ribosomal protein L23 [Candidatus Kaiserbacteria bacterium RIFCSPHIGHO2_01_FULL_49_13]|uniref:Large ribosomal subunit protein uL23 n=1 Tax=Candidatus Kaiserbacteria bacterium RIFCSPHIGHO2_01_FULL_49_13 TaxID=1798477 RepID=A0A1F6CDF8_9BACT|nr:MAG: 50S ribosomal protein L23 [Candidatus Kaiserbacteria bacterium RIFCSPHIGHO2_01_FULL_49_13]
MLRGTNAAILRAPRITEKASFAQERGVYVFTVLPRATKADIGRAVFEIYGVRPRKIHIAQIPSKLVYSARRRKPGIKVGGKKAYVYLRAGEKIEVV